MKELVLIIRPEALETVKKILDETNVGKHFSYQDSVELKAFLIGQYQNWKSGIISSKTKNIEQFSRRNLTGKLSEILETETRVRA